MPDCATREPRGAEMTKLGAIEPKQRTGAEPFHAAGAALPFDMLGFWRWSFSDVVSNATRGVLAEYLVACALGVADGRIREEWAAWDLTALDGTRVEVKSAAYVQTWHQTRLSTISFGVPKRGTTDALTGLPDPEKRRRADVYVFALLAHTEQETLDPLDLAQWEFYVLPTRVLDERTRSQHSIALTSLRSLAGEAVRFGGVRAAIEGAAALQRE
jgi:hypothetical protein